jgi:alpha-tubulin suppressor-like RCC1 family protein
MHAYRCDPTRWVMATPQPNTFNTDFLNPPTTEVVTVAAGAYHNVMINDDGKLEAWGWNGYLCVCVYIYIYTHTHMYI